MQAPIEAPAPLHPRYQREWERDTPHWPKEWAVEVDKHDLSDRRFLTLEHRAAMDAGELDLPERTHAGSDHNAVLVSVRDDAAGTDVAWVDKGIAEVVSHAARLGAPTVESCEAADGWDDQPYLWFKGRRQLVKFQALTADLATDEWRWHLPRFGFGRLRTYAVGIPTEDLPRVAAALREM